MILGEVAGERGVNERSYCHPVALDILNSAQIDEAIGDICLHDRLKRPGVIVMHVTRFRRKKLACYRTPKFSSLRERAISSIKFLFRDRVPARGPEPVR